MCDCTRVAFLIPCLLVICIISNSCQFSFQKPPYSSKKKKPTLCYQVKNRDSSLVCKLSARLLTKGRILRPPLKNCHLLETRIQKHRQHACMTHYHQQYICADRRQSQSLPSLLKHFLSRRQKKAAILSQVICQLNLEKWFAT